MAKFIRWVEDGVDLVGRTGVAAKSARPADSWVIPTNTMGIAPDTA